MLMISHFLSRILSSWFITLFQRSGFNELENVRWKMLKQNKKNSSVEEIVKRKRSVNSDLRRLWVLKLIACWFASISIEIRRQWLWCSRVWQIAMFVIRMTWDSSVDTTKHLIKCFCSPRCYALCISIMRQFSSGLTTSCSCELSLVQCTHELHWAVKINCKLVQLRFQFDKLSQKSDYAHRTGDRWQTFNFNKWSRSAFSSLATLVNRFIKVIVSTTKADRDYFFSRSWLPRRMMNLSQRVNLNMHDSPCVHSFYVLCVNCQTIRWQKLTQRHIVGRGKSV